MEPRPGQPVPENSMKPEFANGAVATHTVSAAGAPQSKAKFASAAPDVAPGVGAPGGPLKPAETSAASAPAAAQSGVSGDRALPSISTTRPPARPDGQGTLAGDAPFGGPTGQNQALGPGRSTQATTQVKVQGTDAADNEGSPAPDRNAVKEEASGEAGTSGRNTGEETVGVAPGRRTATIKPKELAGSVVWAKLAKYPWWPAQVLDEADPWIPGDSEPPRRGAIPVRFFGTYDFAWIESHRAICPYDQDFEEHSSQSKQKSFTDALEEASHFQKTQELPDGFNEDSTPSPQKAPRKGKAGAASRGKSRREAGGGRGTKRASDSGSHKRSVRERQDGIMQQLALAPPPDSPYSHTICLDGVRKVMEAQAAGQYPPPAAPPAAAGYAQPPPFSGGFTPGAFPMAQLTHAQLQQFQQLQGYLHQQQQQMAAIAAQQGGAAGGAAPRPQWPQGYQGYGQQAAGYHPQAGGVQGVLLAAAANQGQLQPKQF